MSVDPNRVKDAVVKAIEQCEPDKLNALLEAACQADEQLRQRIASLLEAPREDDSLFTAQPPSSSPTIDQTVRDQELPGAQLGPYKLLQEIGRGGMGVVYMAEQVEPVRRRVALKIIKPGMDTNQVIARFEAERQALSLMDHPHIAKVLDAGTTASGRPFFVMELVKGQPITKYCDERRLTPRQRLELLLPVCHAIQHAHQKGIIHRDIKPSNILVAEYDQQAIPKVIDFGVAKAISQPLTEKTMFTGLGQIVGTLEYMSPEQARVNQLDVDTRSDIYSLGVLMYELLTGTTPFDKMRLRSAAWDEMMRIIREEEPPKPSTRLSEARDSLPSISAQRQVDPAKLTKMLRRELDWIVMKALDKDRNRRYETANGLGADIEHYLNNEPVLACPPSAAYRLWKLARRNRGLIATAAVVTVALLAGTAVATWQAIRATEAQHVAQQAGEAEQQQRIQAEANLKLAYQALDRIYLRVVEEDLPRYPERLDSYRRLLENALAFYTQIAERHADDPRTRYELAMAEGRAGKIASLLERHDAALTHFRRAQALLESLRKEKPTNVDYRRMLFAVHHELGQSTRKLNQFEEALAALDQAARILGDPQQFQAKSWDARAFVGLALTRSSLDKQTGHFAEGERQLQQAMEVGNRLVGAGGDASDRHLLVKTATQLGQLLSDQGRFEAAEPFLAQSQELLEELLKADPESVSYRKSAALLCLNRGGNLSRLDRNPEARRVLERGVELAEQLEREFPGTPEYSAILVDLESNLDTSRSALATTDPGRLERTVERARRAAAALPEAPEYQKDLAMCLNNHGVNLEGAGRLADALAAYSEGLSVCEKLVAKAPQATIYRDLLVRLLSNLGDVYGTMGRTEEAEKSLRRAIEEVEPLVTSTQKALMYRTLQADMITRLQLLLRTLKRAEEAEELARQVVQHFEAIREHDADSINALYQLARAQVNHGNILNDLKRYPEALATFDRAEETIRGAAQRAELTQQMRSALALVYNNRADVHRTLNEFEPSNAQYRESIRLTEQLIADDKENPQHQWNLLQRIQHLAELYRRANRLRDVEPELKHGVEIGEQLVADFPQIASYQDQSIVLMSFLTALYLERSDLPEASRLAARALELADSAAALAPDDPKIKDRPRQAVINTLAVAQRANDFATQFRGLNRLFEMEPGTPDNLNALAWLLATSPDLTLRDPARAGRLAAEAVSKAPENSDFQGTLGAALYRMGELEKAVPALTEANRLRPPDDPVSSFNNYFLSMVYWRLGRHEEATAAFAQAETLANAMTDAQKEEHGDALALLRGEARGILGPSE